MEEIIQQADKV